MSCFDRFTFKHLMPDGFRNTKELDYQSKELDCLQNEYLIINGRLCLTRQLDGIAVVFNPPKDVNYSGELNIYGYDTDILHEYFLHFENGDLKHIRVLGSDEEIPYVPEETNKG